MSARRARPATVQYLTWIGLADASRAAAEVIVWRIHVGAPCEMALLLAPLARRCVVPGRRAPECRRAGGVESSGSSGDRPGPDHRRVTARAGQRRRALDEHCLAQPHGLREPGQALPPGRAFGGMPSSNPARTSTSCRRVPTQPSTPGRTERVPVPWPTWTRWSRAGCGTSSRPVGAAGEEQLLQLADRYDKDWRNEDFRADATDDDEWNKWKKTTPSISASTSARIGRASAPARSARREATRCPSRRSAT